MPRHLYARLILLIAGILCVAFAAYGWLTGVRQTRIYEESANANQQLLVSSLVEGAGNFLLVEDYAGLEGFIHKAADRKDIRKILVCETDGKLLVQVDHAQGSQPHSIQSLGRIKPPAKSSDYVSRSDDEVVYWQPLVVGSRLGWLMVTYSQDTIIQMRRAIWENTILLALIWIIIASILVILVMQSPIRAIQRLSDFTRGMIWSKGGQVTVDDSTIEIRQLEESINFASRQLLLKQEQLINERERLAITLESIGDGVIAVDTDGRIVLMNRTAEELTGWSTADSKGAPLESVFTIVHEENGSVMTSPASVALETGRIVELADHSALISRSGVKRSIADTAAPILDAQGAIIGVVLVFRDVTERRQQEENIRQLNQELERRVLERTAQLEAANHELESFSFSVSHDLRAPLRNITAFSNILRDDCGEQLNQTSKEALKRILRSAIHMEKLIDDMLQLSRLTLAPMNRKTLDLSALANEVLQDLLRSQPERLVAVQVAEGLRASGDPILVRGVLENLLGNAWKYTGKQEQARIEFGETRIDGEHVFFVRDNGVGFDMAYVDKLFNVFQRLHRVEDFEGTGVGLASVKRIINRHGGRIWAEAEEGKGSTFYFTFSDESPPVF